MERQKSNAPEGANQSGAQTTFAKERGGSEKSSTLKLSAEARAARAAAGLVPPVTTKPVPVLAKASRATVKLPHRATRTALLDILVERVLPPALAQEAPLPLALNIHIELAPFAKPGCAGHLQAWLSLYTKRPDYVRAGAAPDSRRHHLDGTPDEMSEAHRADFARRHEQNERKRAARQAAKATKVSMQADMVALKRRSA